MIDTLWTIKLDVKDDSNNVISYERASDSVFVYMCKGWKENLSKLMTVRNSEWVSEWTNHKR